MISKPFFDTNILVYAHSYQRGNLVDRRTEIAVKLLSDGGSISVQVLNEFYDIFSRRYSVASAEINQWIETVLELIDSPLPLTVGTHKAARLITQRYGFRIYDSLILASALEAESEMLYTEDMQHGQVIEGVRIVNPFR